MEPRPQGRGLIGLTLLLAVLFSVYPLPEGWRWVWPDWTALVLIYWCMYLPHRVGLGWAWLTGLLMDIVHGAALGQHAFALVLLAYFVQISYQRLRMAGVVKQALVVMLLVALHILLYQWVQNLLGVTGVNWPLFAQALASALLWPLLRFILEWVQLRFSVT